jgi:hypothetical protein
VGDLPRPYEILELADGQRIALKVKGYALGTIRILPGDWESRVNADLRRGSIDQAQAKALMRDGKPINALRLLVDPIAKPAGVPYWDVTSTTLIAQLEPHLQQPGYKDKSFTITAFGVAPKKRFSLAVLP